MQITLLSPTAEKLRKLRTVWMKELKAHGLVPGATEQYRRFLRGRKATSDDVDALADVSFAGDRGAANGSSLAFLAEYAGHSVLFGADAHAPLLAESVKQLLRQRDQQRLKLDAFKLSHHGSKKSLNASLLKLLDCRRYLISSDGSYFDHPDREAVARVIKYGRRESNYGGQPPSLYFNYRSEENKIWAREDLQQKYNFQAHFPDEGQQGISVTLG
jgi:beta-lactamase superfamily II metal-dependent hydrolase